MMWKRFLAKINWLFVILISLIFISLQTTLLNIPSSGELQPEFTLLIVIYLGLHRNPLEGGLLAYVLGHLIEIHSGALMGSVSLACLLVFLITRILALTIYIPSLVTSILLVMGMTLIWRGTIGACTWWIMGDTSWIPHALKFLVPSMILHGLIFVPVFNFMKWLDAVTTKDQQTQQDGQSISSLEI